MPADLIRRLQSIMADPNERPAVRENARRLLQGLETLGARGIKPMPREPRPLAAANASGFLRNWQAPSKARRRRKAKIENE